MTSKKEEIKTESRRSPSLPPNDFSGRLGSLRKLKWEQEEISARRG